MRKIIRLTENDLHNIIKASVKRLLREQDEYMDGCYDFLDGMYDEEKERDLTSRYPEFVKAALQDPNKVFYFWVADTEDGTVYSSTCFRSEDEAADDCDRQMGDRDFSGYVDSIGAQGGKIFSDTMLYNEDGFWMD